MSWSDNETLRVQEIERTLNALQLALKNMASTQQLRALLVLKQKEITDLTTQVTSIQTQLSLLQAKL